MAHSTASPTKARTSAQTAPGTQAQETAPFLARRSLPADLTTLQTHPGATATGCANEPQRGPPRRLPAFAGVCHSAQRTSGGGIGWVAEASKSVSCDRTGQQCLRDSSGLCRCSRRLLPGRWSNGTTEGHVNRLKFLKRQMFGRAHLDLLRVKVLHAV